LEDEKVFISDHRHNPFLKDKKHAETEGLAEFNEEGNTIVLSGGIPPERCCIKGNYELWKVYARGFTGNVSGIIYPDWEMIDELPVELDGVYGVDFGYTNDPTAVAFVARVGESLYIDEIAYQTGSIPPRKLKTYLDGLPVYCEHDPDMIKQLKLLQVNAMAARKGPGSIKAGIEKMKEYKVYYTATSKNIKRELGMYIWEVDKMGVSTNVPVDANNHILDAIRYAVYTHFYRSK
jgi:phage terminase large subunit